VEAEFLFISLALGLLVIKAMFKAKNSKYKNIDTPAKKIFYP
jgi:hypothetical protein